MLGQRSSHPRPDARRPRLYHGRHMGGRRNAAKGSAGSSRAPDTLRAEEVTAHALYCRDQGRSLAGHPAYWSVRCSTHADLCDWPVVTMIIGPVPERWICLSLRWMVAGHGPPRACPAGAGPPGDPPGGGSPGRPPCPTVMPPSEKSRMVVNDQAPSPSMAATRTADVSASGAGRARAASRTAGCSGWRSSM